MECVLVSNGSVKRFCAPLATVFLVKLPWRTTSRCSTKLRRRIVLEFPGPYLWPTFWRYKMMHDEWLTPTKESNRKISHIFEYRTVDTSTEVAWNSQFSFLLFLNGPLNDNFYNVRLVVLANDASKAHVKSGSLVTSFPQFPLLVSELFIFLNLITVFIRVQIRVMNMNRNVLFSYAILDCLHQLHCSKNRFFNRQIGLHIFFID